MKLLAEYRARWSGANELPEQNTLGRVIW